MTVKTFDGDEICFTLTARNAGGGQRMPDKQNCSLIVVEVDNEEQLVRRQWADTGSEITERMRNSELHAR